MTALDAGRRAMTGRGALLFSIFVLAVLGYAGYEINTSFTTRARLFANAIVVPALAVGLLQVVRELRRGAPTPAPAEALVTRSALVWGAAFFLAMAAIGLRVTIPLFALAYLRLAAGEAWPKAAAYGAIAWLFVELTFVRLLNIPLPAGYIPLPGITP